MVILLGMAVLLGTSASGLFPLELDEEELNLLVRILRGLVARGDTAINLAAHVAAAAACTLPQFRLSDLVRFVPGELFIASDVQRVLTNAVSSRRWGNTVLVRALCGCVPQDETEAVVIEYEVVGNCGAKYAVISLHALGPGFAIPLDWRRVALDSDDYDESLRAVIAGYLDLLKVHFAGTEDRAPLLVALSPELGEDPQLRSLVGKEVAEYGVLISPGYAQDWARADVEALRRPGGSLGMHFIGWLRGGPSPAPLPLKSKSSPQNEFVVGVNLGEDRCLAVVRPQVLLPPGVMRSPMLRDRASKLRDILTRIQTPRMTHALRLDAFVHQSNEVFRRHALLMSIVYTMLMGRMTPPAPASEELR